MRYESCFLTKPDLKRKKIFISDVEEPCNVCGLYTFYRDAELNCPICSDECMNEWNHILAEALGKECLI